ncbi:MAG: HupE/UreJ protein [Sphingomonas bacterium]|nr:HupE/UreJ protein [Sphingomonas bacterium]
MLRWLLLLVALFVATPALAHPAPFSYLDVHLRDGGIDGTLVVHVIDVAHDLGLAAPEQLLDPKILGPRRRAIAALVGARLMLRSGGASLTPRWTGIVAVPNDAALRLSFHAAPAQGGALTVAGALFPYDPNHQTFVNVYEGDGLKQQWIFSRSSPPRTHYLGTTAGRVAVMKTFIASGIHHILIGPDHLLFLVALLLLGGSWGTLIRIVTAFTVGHSITLSLAALDIVTPPASFIEPAIALSIVFVGTDNLVRGQGRDLRPWVALLFGLVHGFGFASVLRSFGLPREALGWSLFSFNVGVELGQLAVVLLVASLLDFIRRRSHTMAHHVVVAGSTVVIAAGTYWFVQRLFFPEGI